MEDLMATTLELPTKRSSEEMGSGSGLDLDLVALKKKRVHSILSNCYSIKDFVRRCRSSDPDGIEIEDPLTEWRRHVQKVYERCITQEMYYYRALLIKQRRFNLLQSSEDESIDPGREFSNKGWILRAHPGPYSDYERLYVGDIRFCDDELTGEYCNFYLSLDDDLALWKFYKVLQSSITWDSSWSDAQRLVDDAKTEYPDIEPFLIRAVQETNSWKMCEQDKKERVPLFTKLLKEVVRTKRGFKEVLIEIKENDAASFPFYSKIIEHNLWREENVESMGLKSVLDDVDAYINAATKGEHSDEELIRRYCSLNGPSVVYTYAEYLKKKMQIAVKLGIITRTIIGKIPMDIMEATNNWMNTDLDEVPLQIASPAATQMVDWVYEDSDYMLH